MTFKNFKHGYLFDRELLVSSFVGTFMGMFTAFSLSKVQNFDSPFIIKIAVAFIASILILQILTNFRIVGVILLAFVPLVILSPVISVGYIIPIRVDDFFLGLIFVIWLINLIIKVKNPFNKNPLNIPILIYISFYTLSSVLGYYQNTANLLGGILNLVRLIEFVIVYYIIYSIFRVEKLNEYLIVLFGTAIIVLLIGTLQSSFGLMTNVLFDFSNGEEIIPTRFSTFESSHDYGAYLIMITLIFSAIIFSNYQKGIKTAIYWILWGFFFFAVLNSDSRSSILSFIIVLSFLILFSKKTAIFPFALGIFLIPFIAQTEKIQNKLLNPITSPENLIDFLYNDPSIQIRFDNWPIIIEHWTKYPLFGRGPTFFLNLVENYGLSSRAIDNSYIRALGEEGILGLFSFLFLLFIIVRIEFKLFKTLKISIQKYFTLGVLMATISLILIGFWIDVFETFKVMMYFWILTAMTMKIYGQEIEK